MLSKPIGPTGFYGLSATTGTHTATAFSSYVGDPGGTGPGQVLTPLKVRIAVTGQPAVINFGNSKTANNNSDILIPPGTVEHFKLDSTSTITFVEVTGGGANGWISITPVA
jgi:hypothetical protein